MPDNPEHNDQDAVKPDQLDELSEKDLDQVSGGTGVTTGHEKWIEVTGTLQDLGQ